MAKCGKKAKKAPACAEEKKKSDDKSAKISK